MIQRVLFCFIITTVTISGIKTSGAANIYSDVSIETMYTSNVYLDSQKESDFVLSPGLVAGVYFLEYLSLEYNGTLDIYFLNNDLFFHKHGLHFFIEPTWGDSDQNKFTSEIAVVTQRNTSTYEAIDFAEPIVDLAFLLEPSSWFRWSVFLNGAYRLFYNDTASDSADLWGGASAVFTLPSRTTIGPRFRYGFRYYPRQDRSVTDDVEDQQIEAGLHASQGITGRTGLNADYAYLKAIGPSGLIERNLTNTEFSYIGEEFLYSGHSAGIGLKHLFDSGFSIGADFRYELREYTGWTIDDKKAKRSRPDRDQSSSNRKDNRFFPEAWVAYNWFPDKDASKTAPDFSIKLGYGYLYQQSNLKLYNTDRHTVALSAELSW